jgi:hypothetical protein
VPRELNPEIGEGLNDLILGCLEKVPAERMASARELREALQKLA